ncbi:MAG: hypothetical protein LBK25_09360 [Treponema sp.]|nr:hypothetical protein [Treponema sp.]
MSLRFSADRRRDGDWELGGGGRPRKRSGDRGVHRKGVCLPSSVMENRAPLMKVSS